MVIVSDPYVSFMTGHTIQVANALPVALLAVAVGAAIGRPLFAIVLISGAHAFLVHLDHVKSTVLHAHVIYADVRVLPMLITHPSLVMGFVAKSPWVLLAGTIFVAALLYGAWRAVHYKGPAMGRILLTCGSIGALVAILPANGLMPTHPEWVVFQQTDEPPVYGVLANLIYGWRLSGTIIPPGDAESRQRIYSDPVVEKARHELTQPAAITPDIVVVQSESLFDPSTLCNMPDEPVLPAITSTEHSTLSVPVFGGRTLQTEFETLTGVPVAKFSNADFAYLDLLRGSLDALPSQLDRLGYRTIAIHPNDSNFWRRSYAFPALGFQTFIDINAFSGADVDKHGHVMDSALVSAGLSELEAEASPGFVFLVSIENHGPWGGNNVSELDDYVTRAARADAAWRQLIDGLAQRNRPAIALLYGDHLPGLADTYASRCFKDGRPPEMHQPPVAVWSNMPFPLRPPPRASFLTPGWILDAARLPRSEMYALNGAIGLVAEHHGDEALQGLVADYAAVAGNWLKDDVTEAPSPAVLSPEAIGKELKHMLIEGQHGTWTTQDIMLERAPSPSAKATLRLDGRIASVTFRPYPGDDHCKTTDPIAVRIDGRETGIIGGGSSATVATIRTSGAGEMTLTRAPTVDGSTCSITMLRVVQIEAELDTALANHRR